MWKTKTFFVSGKPYWLENNTSFICDWDERRVYLDRDAVIVVHLLRTMRVKACTALLLQQTFVCRELGRLKTVKILMNTSGFDERLYMMTVGNVARKLIQVPALWGIKVEKPTTPEKHWALGCCQFRTRETKVGKTDTHRPPHKWHFGYLVMIGPPVGGN